MQSDLQYKNTKITPKFHHFLQIIRQTTPTISTSVIHDRSYNLTDSNVKHSIIYRDIFNDFFEV